MANPRNTVAFDDIGLLTATFIYDNSDITYDATVAGGSSAVGFAVTTFGETGNVVALAGSGERVTGKLLKVEADGKCTVQVGGFCKLPGGTSATLTHGLKFVGDLGGVSTTDRGYIQAVSTEDTVSRGEIINSATTTAVVVLL